jgi:prepilin-type N-terminal cleavage/methylation domain-containing protein
MSDGRREARLRRQAGFTLIELLVATTIGLLVMSALTSVVVLTMISTNAATGRVEASGQIRNFELFAYDDFALSHPPVPSGCGTAGNPCTTQPMVLSGLRMANQASAPATSFTVSYSWSTATQSVTRAIGSSSQTAAGNVTSFSWYVDATGARPVVVIALTVTIGFYNTSYSQSQTLLFYPRITSP